MDMMTRTAILAGGLVLFAIAAAAGWWFWGDDLLNRSAPPDRRDVLIDPSFDDREGSLLDEFGETSNADARDDRISIRSRDGLELPPPPAGTVAGLPDGPRFGPDRPVYEGFSGQLSGSAPRPRTTASERVEADCRDRGGGSYACRCLVRLARTVLAPAEFEFLSYAEELEPRAERLSSASLELSDLPGVTIKLVELDANARRRCGAGLKP